MTRILHIQFKQPLFAVAKNEVDIYNGMIQYALNGYIILANCRPLRVIMA